MGEFYWKVEVGEEVAARDLICPPYSISVERSIAPGLTMPEEGKKGKKKLNLGEVNMTLATYVPHAVIESAFSVKELPRSWQVAPNQPTPVEGKLFMNWLMFAVAGFIVYFGAAAISANADGWLLVWYLFLISIIPLIGLIVNHTFNVKRWSESDYSPYASSD